MNDQIIKQMAANPNSSSGSNSYHMNSSHGLFKGSDPQKQHKQYHLKANKPAHTVIDRHSKFDIALS